MIDTWVVFDKAFKLYFWANFLFYLFFKWSFMRTITVVILLYHNTICFLFFLFFFFVSRVECFEKYRCFWEEQEVWSWLLTNRGKVSYVKGDKFLTVAVCLRSTLELFQGNKGPMLILTKSNWVRHGGKWGYSWTLLSIYYTIGMLYARRLE